MDALREENEALRREIASLRAKCAHDAEGDASSDVAATNGDTLSVPRVSALTSQEIERYSRQLLLPEWRMAGMRSHLRMVFAINLWLRAPSTDECRISAYCNRSSANRCSDDLDERRSLVVLLF